MRYHEITEDFNLDAYHGTTADFDAFDPGRTRDIGMHFGSATQADNAIKDVYGKRKDGANIIPVKLRVHNPLRVPDMFDTMRTTYINRAKTFCLLIRGFRASREERAAIFDAAKVADKARRKAGGDWGALDRAKEQFQAPAEAAAKVFWRTVQVSAERQGYDGFVYSNKIEGKGDSYVVFRPQNIRSRYANFDPSKADSDKLMDDRIVESVIRLGGLRVFKNPSQKQFESLRAKLNPDNSDKTMRAILDGTDLYLWDAIYAEHQGIADSLGIGDPNGDSYFEISDTVIVVNWGDKTYDKPGLKKFCTRLQSAAALHRILGPTPHLKVVYW
jgi:hypothetical protein